MVAITVKDICPHKFITAYASYLKRSGKLEVPKWVDLVKTAPAKELAPQDPDWFFVRVASIARMVYINKGVGCGKLRKMHGSRMRRGHRPNIHSASSGSVVRKALQALEKIKVLEKNAKGGRAITQVGQQELDRIAGQVYAAAH